MYVLVKKKVSHTLVHRVVTHNDTYESCLSVTGVSPQVHVWVVPVVLMVFIITAVAVLIATCYITTHKYDNR